MSPSFARTLPAECPRWPVAPDIDPVVVIPLATYDGYVAPPATVESDVKVGAGVGLRYITPFGPLRVDAAIPLNRGPGDPTFGIYAGIGQAF